MTANAQPSDDDPGEDTSTRVAFTFFMGTLLLALLGALWMLIQMALL